MIAPRRRPSSMAHVVDIEDLTWGPRAGWNAPRAGSPPLNARRCCVRWPDLAARSRLGGSGPPSVSTRAATPIYPDERITPPTSVLTRAPHCNAR